MAFEKGSSIPAAELYSCGLINHVGNATPLQEKTT